MQIYAIGDIHGQLNLLQAAHDRIADDIARYGPGPVVHVGDLVDRGPDSRGVIEFLMKGLAQGQDWIVIKGNHDSLFTRFLADPADRDPRLWSELSWLHPRLGGAATLGSYGVANASDRPVALVHADAIGAVPADHIAFINALPLSHQAGASLFVHAGIRPGVQLHDQIESDLLWIREPFLMDPVSHGPLVVHGHTTIDAATHYGNRVNLDSGAAYGGPLSAVVIEDREAFLLTASGRERLPSS
jgi:serine/threonine protein phosphatase 1